MKIHKRVGAAVLAAWLSACAGGAEGLDALHADIAADYPGVAHVGADALAAMPDAVLLDVREPEEFAVSRLPGAIRVDADEDAQALLSRLPALEERTVVAYCSVGRRSSILTERLSDDLLEAGAGSVVNLRGGVFGWHGEGRPLVDADGPTDLVHPYDAVWARYVVRGDKTAYIPEP